MVWEDGGDGDILASYPIYPRPRAGAAIDLRVFSVAQNAEMHSFRYVGRELFCEDVALSDLVQKHGTPLYV